MNRDLASTAQPAAATFVEGRRVVAVVGIDRYVAWPTLSNAVNDALGALDVFRRLGFEPIVAPLLNEMATADAIRRLVTDDLAMLGSADSLVLFFAGHGHTQTRVLQSGPVQTGFLIPVDGDPSEGRTATWLRLDSWLSDVARLPARHILVILDACHSGVALGSVIKWRDAGAERSGSLDELRRRQSRRVIASALGDQRAMDGGPVAGHSLFTGCLIEGPHRRARTRWAPGGNQLGNRALRPAARDQLHCLAADPRLRHARARPARRARRPARPGLRSVMVESSRATGHGARSFVSASRDREQERAVGHRLDVVSEPRRDHEQLARR